ncbi:MAG: DUF427 domain-containing protein [Myxococcota bacterium]
MAKATWNGVVIAESDQTEMVEGNHYFPRASIKTELFTPTEHTSVCPWKGTATYFTIEVDGKKNENAAWTYESPKSAAANIKDHVAFWKGVEVTA